MLEKMIVKEELIKNMILTFCVIVLLFILFDVIIYNQVKHSLYENIDNELIQCANNYCLNIINPFDKQNPRMIYIIRDINENIINEKSIGRMYNDYLISLPFDKSLVNSLYTLNIANEYKYRGVTMQLENFDGIIAGYVQILANVDGETQTLNTLLGLLGLVTVILVIILVLVSYGLSRRTLRPIVESLKKQTEFVQNASHELRTPIAIIQAKQQLLLQEPNAKIIDKSEDISLVIKESKRLTKLIRELLILAASDSNNLELKKENINVDDLIKEITKSYIDFAKIEKKEINLDLNSNIYYSLDKDKISQLLIILLDNAIKYTKENESIEIKTYSKDSKIFIEVADTGIGISEEAKKHIFERFYREDKARSRENGGTGLGLSIAYTIVKLHGGYIKVLNNTPKGTRFIIKI